MRILLQHMKPKQKPLAIFIKIALFAILAGAVTYGILYYTILVPFREDSDRMMKEFEERIQQKEPELTSTITPARDLSGEWVGLFESQENTPDVDCLYTSTFELRLQQNGNSLEGRMIFTDIDVEQDYKSSIPIPCGVPIDRSSSDPITGTVSSSALNIFRGGTKVMSGSFTTDNMMLVVDRCVMQPYGKCTVANDGQATVILSRRR